MQLQNLLVLLVLLPALLPAAVSGDHDPNFCELTPTSQTKLPPGPTQFALTTTVETPGKSIITSRNYYNTELQRSAFIVSAEPNYDYRILLDHANKQALMLNQTSKAVPGQCTVQEVDHKEVLIELQLTPKLGAVVQTAELFFGNGKQGVVDQGDDNINGVKTKKFYSCFYESCCDVSMEVTWHFTQVGNSSVPLRVITNSQYNKDNKTQMNATFEVSDYHSGGVPDTHSALRMPEGVYCDGLRSNRQLPKLPDRFSFRVEQIIGAIKEPIYMHETYDFQAQLSALSTSYVSTGLPNKYGPGRLLILHDYGKHHAFIINRAFGNCTYENLQGKMWDGITDSSTLRIRSPMELFQMKNSNPQFKGQGMLRGMKSDIFAGLNKYKMPQNNEELNVAVEWQLVNKTEYDMFTKKRTTVAYPSAIYSKSENPSLNMMVQVYDFNTKDVMFGRHDISSCFMRSQKRRYQVYFPMTDSPNFKRFAMHRPNEFLGIALPLITKAGGFSALRIYDLELSYTCCAVVEFSLTDAPARSNDVTLDQADKNLRRAIEDGTIIAKFTDGYDNQLTVVANRMERMKAPQNDADGWLGYTSGQVAGAAIGLLLAGLVAGLLATFIYLR